MRSPLLFRGICVIGVLLGAASCNAAREEERQLKELLAMEAEAEARKAEEEKRKLERAAKEQEQRIDSLLDQLSNAKDEATRLALQKQLEAEQSKSKAASDGNTAPARPTAKPCNCAPADPLCSCL